MILYYHPGGCSLADHIALIEAGLRYRLVKVERGKRTEDGRDYMTINPKGFIPALELDDGSVVGAKAVGRAPGATAQDIPLLKLEVTSHRGAGRLTDVTTVLRLDTRGGNAEGSCPSAGALLSVPYFADYAFYQKGK